MQVVVYNGRKTLVVVVTPLTILMAVFLGQPELASSHLIYSWQGYSENNLA